MGLSARIPLKQQIDAQSPCRNQTTDITTLYDDISNPGSVQGFNGTYEDATGRHQHLLSPNLGVKVWTHLKPMAEDRAESDSTFAETCALVKAPKLKAKGAMMKVAAYRAVEFVVAKKTARRGVSTA